MLIAKCINMKVVKRGGEWSGSRKRKQQLYSKGMKEWSIISANLILWKITHLVSFCLNKEKNSESAFQNAIKSVICAEVTHDLTLNKASVFVMARYAKYVAA